MVFCVLIFIFILVLFIYFFFCVEQTLGKDT